MGESRSNDPVEVCVEVSGPSSSGTVFGRTVRERGRRTHLGRGIAGHVDEGSLPDPGNGVVGRVPTDSKSGSPGSYHGRTPEPRR